MAQRARFGVADLAAVAAEMRRYQRACRDLEQLLSKDPRTPRDTERAIAGYRDLKAELRRDAERGTMGGEKRPLSEAETFFFAYAVRHAAQALRPATNPNRVVGTWRQAVSNARQEIEYKLHDLETRHPGA